MTPEALATILGILASVLLAVPAIRGLNDRRSLDRALREYQRDKPAYKAEMAEIEARRQRGEEIREDALPVDPRDLYEANRDTILADAIGGFWSNTFWTFLGLGALALAFVAQLCAR